MIHPTSAPVRAAHAPPGQQPASEAAPPLRPSPRISAACFLFGAICFTAGWALLAIAAPDLTAFFYESRVLAVTHTFTLGWITVTIIGVLYQYVPALTKRPLPAARWAGVPPALIAAGALGMIAHFWLGRLPGMAWSAGVVTTGIVLFAAQVLPALRRAPVGDATVIGAFCAVSYLVLAAAFGLLFAVDKVHPFLGGSPLSNLAAHSHLALLGWASLMICTISYRMVAAFALPARLWPRGSRRQIFALAGLVPALFVALLLRSAAIRLLAPLVVAAMAWYAGIVAHMIRARRLPLDWSLRHALGALAHLGAAAGIGLCLVFAADPGDQLGARLVAAYGCLLFGGWISNFIIGVGSRMAPGLMGKAGPPILTDPWRAALFWLLNGGVAAVVASVLSGSAAALRLAALLPLAAGVLFTLALARHLRQAVRRRL